MKPNILFKIPTCQGLQLISIDEIIRVEAISNYSKIYFSNGKTLVVAKVLRWFQEQLAAIIINDEIGNSNFFIRTHRTHLVNIHFIRSYANSKIELQNNQTIDLARRKKVAFLKHWNTYEAVA